MITANKLAEIKRTIDEYWQGDQLNEDDDYEIEYEICTGMIHSLFLDTEKGLISMGCHFQYDENPEDYDPLEDDKTYLWENAFCEYLDKHSEFPVCSWHDTCYDLGYPGTDYERIVGFRGVDCSETIIKEYLQLTEMFEKRFPTFMDAVDFLFRCYTKYSFGRNIHAYANSDYWSKEQLSEVEVSYEGTDYYFCRWAGQVYMCDLSDYKRISNLFNNCTLHHKMGMANGCLWFISPFYSVKIIMREADESSLKLEAYFHQIKQQRNLLARDQLFRENDLQKSDKEIKNDRQFAKEIATACVKLIQKPLFLHQTEDNRNDQIRDYLSARGYDVKDQTRTGRSSSGKSIGEADLVIIQSDIPVTFIEALNLDSVKKAYIHEHIDRVFKYDCIGTSANFIVCYVNTKDCVSFRERYLECIIEKYTGYEVVDIDYDVKDILDSAVSNVRIIKMSYNRNQKITDLYHILAFFGE